MIHLLSTDASKGTNFLVGHAVHILQQPLLMAAGATQQHDQLTDWLATAMPAGQACFGCMHSDCAGRLRWLADQPQANSATSNESYAPATGNASVKKGNDPMADWRGGTIEGAHAPDLFCELQLDACILSSPCLSALRLWLYAEDRQMSRDLAQL